METLHASCIAIHNHGVLVVGESGSGKSDLALRMIDRGAKLVSDDQVVVAEKEGTVFASAPATIAGLLEVRGLGIFRTQEIKDVPLSLVVQLVVKGSIERLPEPKFHECVGVIIPQINIVPFEVSAPIKIEMAIAALYDGSMRVGALNSSSLS